MSSTLTQEQRAWPRLMEAAGEAGLSPSRLRDLVYAGRVAAVKDGIEWRVNPLDVAWYVRERKGKAGRPRKGTRL